MNDGGDTWVLCGGPADGRSGRAIFGGSGIADWLDKHTSYKITGDLDEQGRLIYAWEGDNEPTD